MSILSGFGNVYKDQEIRKGYNLGDKVIIKDNNRFIIGDIQSKKGPKIKIIDFDGAFNTNQCIRCTINALSKFGFEYNLAEEIVAGQRIVPITISTKPKQGTSNET